MTLFSQLNLVLTMVTRYLVTMVLTVTKYSSH